MTEEHLEIVAACRRSRIKLRVFRALVERSPLLPSELVESVDTTLPRVRGVLHGDGRKFRHDTALVTLGVVAPAKTERGEAYAITPRGRSAAAFVLQRTADRG